MDLSESENPRFLRRYFRLPPEGAGYLRFLLEAYDGLVNLRVLDGRTGVVEIAFSPSLREEVEDLLAVLQGETGLTSIPEPPEAAVDPL